MTFLSPWWLLMLLPVAALAAGYVIMQRRRSRYAVRFASLPMLERVAPKSPGWRRHLPAAFVLLAMGSLGLAAARPELALRVPYDRATVLVAIDTSGSMAADDVPPTRLEAAKSAATAFVAELPAGVNVGVITFAGSASVVAAPSTDHNAVEQQIASIDIGRGGTAIGESVFSATDVVAGLAAEADGAEVPTRLVLLSDGDNTAGRSVDSAAQAAAAAGLPVSTILYGTASGMMPDGQRAARVDPQTLQDLADVTGGTAYTAESGEQLAQVYEDIGSAIGWRTEQTEVTPYLAALGLLVLVGAGALSLRWFSRII